MIRSKTITTPIYNDTKINVNHNGCYTRLLDRIHTLHRHALQRRQRNLFTMLTFTVPQNLPFPEDIFSRFLEAFIRHLTRNGSAPFYFWVREQQTAPTPHWHLLLWISGHQHHSAFTIIQSAQHYWNRLFSLPDDYLGLVGWNAATPEIFLDSNDPGFEHQSQSVLRWSSYLAKCTEKDLTPRNVRSYGSSYLQN